MAHITIQPEHLPAMSRLQHVLEWLQSEQARLQVELQAVARAGAQKQAELVAFLQQSYGLDAQHVPWTLDVERGVIVTPDPEAPIPPPTEPEPSPAPSAAVEGPKRSHQRRGQ